MKKLSEITIDNIKILSMNEIEEKFNISEKDIFNFIDSKNNSENYWYPYDENDFNENKIKKIIELFKSKFNDTEINSENNYKYTEIYLNTIDKHIFAFSLINYFTENK